MFPRSGSQVPTCQLSYFLFIHEFHSVNIKPKCLDIESTDIVKYMNLNTRYMQIDKKNKC